MRECGTVSTLEPDFLMLLELLLLEVIHVREIRHDEYWACGRYPDSKSVHGAH